MPEIFKLIPDLFQGKKLLKTQFCLQEVDLGNGFKTIIAGSLEHMIKMPITMLYKIFPV